MRRSRQLGLITAGLVLLLAALVFRIAGADLGDAPPASIPSWPATTEEGPQVNLELADLEDAGDDSRRASQLHSGMEGTGKAGGAAMRVVDASDGSNLPRFPLRLCAGESTVDLVADDDGFIYRGQLPEWALSAVDLTPMWGNTAKMPPKYLNDSAQLRAEKDPEGFWNVYATIGASYIVKFALEPPRHLIYDLYTAAQEDPVDCLLLGRSFLVPEGSSRSGGTRLYFPPLSRIELLSSWTLRVASQDGMSVAEAIVPSGVRGLEVWLSLSDSAAIDLEIDRGSADRPPNGAVYFLDVDGVLARIGLEEMPERICGLTRHNSVMLQLDAPLLEEWEASHAVFPGSSQRFHIPVSRQSSLQNFAVNLIGACGDGVAVELILRSQWDMDLLFYEDGSCPGHVVFCDVPPGLYHLSVMDDLLRPWTQNPTLVNIPSVDIDVACSDAGNPKTYSLDIPSAVLNDCDEGGYWVVLDSAGNRFDEGFLRKGTAPTFEASDTANFTWCIWACSGLMAWGDEGAFSSIGDNAKHLALQASDFCERLFVGVISGAEVPIEGVKVLVNGQRAGHTSRAGVIVVEAHRGATLEVASPGLTVVDRFGPANGEPGREATFVMELSQD